MSVTGWTVLAVVAMASAIIGSGLLVLTGVAAALWLLLGEDQ